MFANSMKSSCLLEREITKMTLRSTLIHHGKERERESVRLNEWMREISAAHWIAWIRALYTHAHTIYVYERAICICLLLVSRFVYRISIGPCACSANVSIFFEWVTHVVVRFLPVCLHLFGDTFFMLVVLLLLFGVRCVFSAALPLHNNWIKYT